MTTADAADCDASATRNSNTLQHTATHCNTMQNVRRCLATGIIVAHLVMTPSCLVQDSFWHIRTYIHTHTRAHAHTRARAHTHTPIDDILFNSILKSCPVHVSFSTHTHMHTRAHTPHLSMTSFVVQVLFKTAMRSAAVCTAIQKVYNG